MISGINRQEKLTLELLKVNVISKDLFFFISIITILLYELDVAET